MPEKPEKTQLWSTKLLQMPTFSHVTSLHGSLGAAFSSIMAHSHRQRELYAVKRNERLSAPRGDRCTYDMGE